MLLGGVPAWVPRHLGADAAGTVEADAAGLRGCSGDRVHSVEASLAQGQDVEPRLSSCSGRSCANSSGELGTN